MTLLGISLDPMDLSPMSPPLPFSIIHLKEMDQYGVECGSGRLRYKSEIWNVNPD